jgi:hypothetical protein
MRKGLIVAAIVGAALTGCIPVDHDYHGTVTGSSDTSVATHINAAPITVTGTGEAVKTVELESGGYTVNYTAASNFSSWPRCSPADRTALQSSMPSGTTPATA